MSGPLVSVVTPTWQRHDFLLGQCIPSVAAQTWPDVEHVVVSDGPDLDLKLQVKLQFPQVRYDEMPDGPGGHWGHEARLHAIELAKGDLITYLDDDDTYRPDHCRLLAEALIAHPEADFAYSQMLSGGAVVVGQEPPVYCQIGTPMIMHRRGLLERGTWERSLPSIDWDLVSRWLNAGARYVHVPEVTVDVWPSAFR